MKLEKVTINDIALSLDNLASLIYSLTTIINRGFDSLENMLRKEVKELRQEKSI